MRILLAVAAVVATLGVSSTASAQSAVEGRVDRLEREMRAVQRKVFPGGAGQTFEPQITAPTDSTIPGMPSTSPITDLTQRVAALESQVATITGQVEQTQYRLRQLEDAFNAYKRATDARLKTLETAPAAATPALSDDLASIPAKPVAKPAATKPAPAADTEEPAATKPSGSRATQVAAIERPASDDPAEDAYIYGYRLWAAKLYPEARKELETVVNKYPKHRRASYAQNLLGRAYLDAGAPSLAAVAFYENYKKNPNGERAADSLFYLAQALVKLNKPASEVCKVYGELTSLYGDSLSESRKAEIADGRAASKCK